MKPDLKLRLIRTYAESTLRMQLIKNKELEEIVKMIKEN